jgi:RHS repeat-associated protein
MTQTGNTLSDPSGKSYSWDFENRLTQVVKPGVGTTTFRYDPFGRRIQKSGPLGTTNYLYDGSFKKGRNVISEETKGWSVIDEISSSGNVLAQYTQGQGIDEPLAEFRSGTISYFEGDGVGSVTSLSNSGQILANTYAYDSFGKVTASTGTLTNPFQYTGREFDQETGTYYYRARYYDQNVGRFASEDPIRSRGGINFYAYAGNSPVNFVDPLGLERKDPLHVPCDADELLDCYDRCGSRGVETCEVTWFWKLRRYQPGKGYTYDWVRGEMNCVCNEPNELVEKCKKRVPWLIPFFVFVEEYGPAFAL